MREEKVKVHHFLRSFPTHMKDCIEFKNTKIMDETIQKAHICDTKM